YPIYSEVMEHCTILKTRKDFYFVFMNRAYPKNMKILDEIIRKRDQLARLIGFNSFSELDLDSQMVKSPQKAREFLLNLSEKTMKKSDKEFAKLKSDLPGDIKLDENEKMFPWDYKYVKQFYKKKNFNIDERDVAQYFPVENTLNQVFDIYQRFLGLEFKPVDAEGLWHEDVKVIRVYDKETGEDRGTLFLDLYPRENKYSHACMAEIVATTKRKDLRTGKEIVVPAVIVVIANFPKATEDRPALLKYDDVQTFFHEFGHAMHGFLGRTQMASFSGTSVKRDFVEMPSQMFEEWMWNKDILRKVSKHYKTGESLPDDLIDKMISLKLFDSGFFVTRQVYLSLLALDYFGSGAKKDTNNIKRVLYKKYINHIRFEPGTHFQTSFGHLIGYGAKYYGYMWSKVFALDMFNEVRKVGLLDIEMGRKLEKDVLGKGGSIDPEILLRNFLGRAPNQEAFLREYGIH
ncbi:M3 family metallopeptidase, partial [Candidatus Dependentiae bacterium]